MSRKRLGRAALGLLGAGLGAGAISRARQDAAIDAALESDKTAPVVEETIEMFRGSKAAPKQIAEYLSNPYRVVTPSERIKARRAALADKPYIVTTSEGMPIDTAEGRGFLESQRFKKGGAVKPKKMSSGGVSSASKRADGIATRGKTKCKIY